MPIQRNVTSTEPGHEYTKSQRAPSSIVKDTGKRKGMKEKESEMSKHEQENKAKKNKQPIVYVEFPHPGRRFGMSLIMPSVKREENKITKN